MDYYNFDGDWQANFKNAKAAMAGRDPACASYLMSITRAGLTTFTYMVTKATGKELDDLTKDVLAEGFSAAIKALGIPDDDKRMIPVITVKLSEIEAAGVEHALRVIAGEEVAAALARVKDFHRTVFVLPADDPFCALLIEMQFSHA